MILELSFKILCCAATSISILFLIFKVDVIPHYVFAFSKTARYKYFLDKGLGKYDNFFGYLWHKKRNFFTGLLSCPYCLGFWICLAANSIASLEIQYLLVTYFIVIEIWRKIEK